MDAARETGAFGPRGGVQGPVECSLGSRGTSLGGFWAAVLTPLGEVLWGLFGSFWGLLGASLRPLGGLLGPLGSLLGPLWALWGPRIKFLTIWSPSWAPLGAFSGPFLALLGASWGSWGPPDRSWGRLGAVLGASRAVLERSWAVLERRRSERARKPKTLKNTMENQRFRPLGALLGGFFGASWGVLRASWAVLGPYWASLGSLEAFLAIFRARVACRGQFDSGPGQSRRLWDPPKLPGGPHGGVRQRPRAPPGPTPIYIYIYAHTPPCDLPYRFFTTAMTM